MTSAAIAAEIHAGLIEAARDTGQGEFTAVLLREADGPAFPGDPTVGTLYGHDVTILDAGTKDRYNAGTQTRHVMRKLLFSAVTTNPAKSDRILLPDGVYDIEEIHPLSPGGDDLMFTVWVNTTPSATGAISYTPAP